MKRNLAICWWMGFCLWFSSADAQDICSGILAYTGHDQVSEARENSVAADMFNQHCEGSSIRNSSSTSVGLEAIVKAVPFKFNFGGSSDEEKLSNFCKVYSSRRAEFSAERIDRSTVVREALIAFNRCVELSTKGIYFNPNIGRTTIVIDIRRGSEDSSITGVTYDSELLTCRLPPTNAGPASIADKDSVRSLDGNYLPITCERTPLVRASGEKVYPRAELTIATSRGSLLLPVSEDSFMPEQWASQIQDAMKGISEQIENLRKPKQLECKVRDNASGRTRFPSVIASMTDEEKKAGFRVSGGGCEQVKPDENFALIQSRPDGDASWFCHSGDLPGIPGNIQIRAYVVFCRISEQ